MKTKKILLKTRPFLRCGPHRKMNCCMDRGHLHLSKSTNRIRKTLDQMKRRKNLLPNPLYYQPFESFVTWSNGNIAHPRRGVCSPFIYVRFQALQGIRNSKGNQCVFTLHPCIDVQTFFVRWIFNDSHRQGNGVDRIRGQGGKARKIKWRRR